MADVTIDTFPLAAKNRFWSKVDLRGPDDCWMWKTGTDRDGYGKFSLTIGEQRWHMRAPQVSLILSGSPRPYDRHALHSCDVPGCCNPNHLRWGTARQNVKDMTSRDRELFGERNHQSILTVAALTRIRSELAKRRKELAAEYGVTEGALQNALGGKTWIKLI